MTTKPEPPIFSVSVVHPCFVGTEIRSPSESMRTDQGWEFQVVGQAVYARHPAHLRGFTAEIPRVNCVILRQDV